ncbi:MAG: hypothetical protein IRZ31_12045, partial [Thermogemmatispora sp.]|uniref:NotI family restriction endonuclease n=1 Tax=Thermogemmatispora sp. TaxID=1968838 RepID=UPI00262757B4
SNSSAASDVYKSQEVQAVYISGNVRAPFEQYMTAPRQRANMDWSRQRFYPRPDYLSSSRKRLAPQLLYKGAILSAWGKKMAVAVDGNFFATLPPMEATAPEYAEIAWLIYDLQHREQENRYYLTHTRTVYTAFQTALTKIITAEPGYPDDFLQLLQSRLDSKRRNGGQQKSLFEISEPHEWEED